MNKFKNAWPNFDLQLHGEGGAGDPPAGGNAPAPAQGAAPAGGDGGAAPSGSDGKFDKEYVERLRNESAAERTKREAIEAKLAEAQAKLQEHEDKNKTTETRVSELAQKLDEALSQSAEKQKVANQRIVSSELRRLANEDGLIDGDLLKLFDKRGIEVDEEGNVSGLTDKWTKFKEDKPHLFNKAKKGSQATPPTAGGGNGGDPTPPTKDYMKADAKEVDADWNKYGSTQMRAFTR